MKTTLLAMEVDEALPQTLTELPTDAVALILVRLERARDIARTAPTCRALRDAARIAEKAHRRVCLEGHIGVVNCVVVAPDGRILSGSGNKTVKVWRDGACERTIQAHTSHVLSAVAVLPGGARFVSGSMDNTAKLWTLDGALERTFEVGGYVSCVAALPGGAHFVVGLGMGGMGSGLNEGDLRLYHVDGTLVHTFKGHSQAVRAVSVTCDGQYIISGSGDRRVKVWNVATKSLVSTCRGHTGQVTAVAAMPDGQRFLSGGGFGDKTVRVWLLNGTLQNTFELHRMGYVNALVALPDNQHALSGSGDQTVKLFNVNDGAALRTFKHHTDFVTSLALLPDGLRFVSGSGDKTARIVEIW